MSSKARDRRTAAIVLTLLGVAIILLSAGVIPLEPDSLNVPLWILTVIGVLLLSAGLSAFLPSNSASANAFIAVTLALFALVLTWVSLWGDSRAFSGGIPLLPGSVNVVLARVVFGSLALVLWILTGVVWQSSRVRKRE
ncbi:MAG: hypothetical protein ABIF77_20995 [bacterium]